MRFTLLFVLCFAINICKSKTSSEQSREEHDKTESKIPIAAKGVIGASVGVAVVNAAPVAVGLLGFTGGGVAAGSIAALWQSTIGSVAAGSIFAALQSFGATAAVATVGGAAVGIGAPVAAAAGIYCYYNDGESLICPKLT